MLSLQPVPLSVNAQAVLAKRYLLRDEAGNLTETPDELFWRVARYIAAGDQAYGATDAQVAETTEQFYQLMASMTFLPNSPTLMNAGRPLGQLSACFVLPVEDSLTSIFETLKDAALIHQSGGGTGFSFSRLRPRGDVVRSTMGVSSGPVSFMTVYNAATEAIKQGGTRRGANMGVLRVDHPDIEEFITCKADLTHITNFNISVAVTDAFMHAVQADADFPLCHPATGETVKTVRAKALFNLIVDQAWQTGEPGLVFIDRINQEHVLAAVGPIESTNPCGEVPLLPYEACNLGSINLGQFLTVDNKVDWEKLATVTQLAVHFLDNVITQNTYPLPQIAAQVEANRKIGLGVMGWADLLLALNIPYNATEAVILARDVMSWIDFHSKQASVALAQTRGAFPNFAKSRYNQPNYFSTKHGDTANSRIKQLHWADLDRTVQQYGIRHATTTCIAPTGTISIIAGASGGIEPLFSLVFERHVMEGTRLMEVNPQFEAVAKANGFYSDTVLDAVAAAGTLAQVSEVPQAIKRYFVTAHDIAPQWHIRMQAAFQEFTDNAVSKTINFAEGTTKAQVAEAYWQAWESDVIKGVTVYRNNCRTHQPMAFVSRAKNDLPTPFCETDTLNAPWQCRDCD